MLFRFPPKVIGPSAEEREFLTSIDKRVRYQQETESHVYGRHNVSIYRDNEIITVSEITRALSLIGEERRLALNPINTNWGLSVGFSIGHVGPIPDLKNAKAEWQTLLQFLERQLPENYNFTKLAEVFTRPPNVALVTSCGLKAPVDNIYNYDY